MNKFYLGFFFVVTIVNFIMTILASHTLGYSKAKSFFLGFLLLPASYFELVSRGFAVVGKVFMSLGLLLGGVEPDDFLNKAKVFVEENSVPLDKGDD